MDLFDSTGQTTLGVPEISEHAPLAVRMRPTHVDEVTGQQHLLKQGSPLRRLLEPSSGTFKAAPGSVILWGPPGTGKTTLAYLIAQNFGRRFVELSAVTAGVKDVRAVIEDARRRLTAGSQETVLFIDEVHRFSKSQQDALLPAVENRWVTLVAATTENPSFSVNSPLLSRSLLLTLQPLHDDDIARLLERAIQDPKGLDNEIKLTDEAQEHLLRLAGGDARKALTILEAAAGAALEAHYAQENSPHSDCVIVDVEVVEQAVDVAAVRYDRDGDQHYDVVSAFIKSMRGSDVQAALHYLARMIVAGEDPRFIARRVVISASEDVGMADPSALQSATAAAQAVQLLGMPEAKYALAQAVVHIATAPKSNRVHDAVNAAIAEVQSGRIGVVPEHLRDGHYVGAKKLGHAVGYLYAHDFPHAIAPQQYLPDALLGVEYYRPSDRGFERNVTQRLDGIDAILRDERGV
ncbi:replication-associated recombination protein A [Timonella sp. A28]|uniref:replication-associated recombination protein A n=1 Tax=Timonella sp. A28 TaxID=3442640 RepID=UPI003EBC86C9